MRTDCHRTGRVESTLGSWLVALGCLSLGSLALAPRCGAHAAEPAPQTPSASVPAPATSAAAPTTLGEITVTADRRRQPAREVPMHVSVVSADALRERGASHLSDYVATQPNVVFASAGGPGLGMLVMRGVTTGNQTSSTVSEYIDDVPVGSSTVYAASGSFVFDPALLDLDHIEFLYGPQGTLYGAGSMGGLIKYVTRKPDTERTYGNVGVGMSQTAHGGLNYGEHAMLNLPIKKDKAALRVSAIDEHRAGVYQAVGETPAHRDDRNHTRGARVQLQVYPTNRLSFNVSAMVQRIAADGLSMADYDLAGQPISGGPFNRSLNHREPYVQTLKLYAFDARYDFGWSTLAWTSAYQEFDNRGDEDYPDGFLALLNAFGPMFGVEQPLGSLYVASEYGVHKSSQEVRLTSPRNPHVDWLLGVWLTREDDWEEYALQGDNVPPPVGITRLLGQQVHSRFDEYAAYGNATWHVTPTIDLTGGVRATGNKQTLSNFEGGPVAGSPGGFSEHTDRGDLTWLFTTKYQPNAHRSYYFRAATGYRPGGLQAPVTSTIIGTNPDATDRFGSDTLQSYEAGFKGDYLGGHLSLGVDGYDIEWHHIQLYTFLLGNSIVQNAGDARVDGGEFQAVYRLGRWQFTGAGAYTNARTLEASPQASIPAGAQLPYSAKRTLTLGAAYAWHLGANPAHLGADLRTLSHRNAGFTNDPSDPNFSLPGHTLVDLNAGVTLGHGKGVNIDAFVRNVFNRQVPDGTLNADVIDFLASLGGPMLVHLTNPRTIGVSVTVPF